MRSIIGAQLGKDGLDSTLDGFLGDLQLIRDLLLAFPMAIKRSTLISAGVGADQRRLRSVGRGQRCAAAQPVPRDSRGQASQQGGSKTAGVQGFASSLATSSITDGSALQDRCAANTGAAKILPGTLAILREDNRMLIGGNLRCGAKWMQEPRWNRAFPVVSGYTTARRGSWLSQTLRAIHEHDSPKHGVALAGSESYLAPLHYSPVICRSSPTPPRSGQPCCGEGPQIYPPHHQRWSLSRLCRCHFAGPPGLHVVCHPGRP